MPLLLLTWEYLCACRIQSTIRKGNRRKNYCIKLNLMLGCFGKFRRCDVRDKFLFRTDNSSIILSVKSEYSQRWILNASVTENRAVPISLYPILPERAARLRKKLQAVYTLPEEFHY